VTARCPSELALERHLLEPEGSPLQPHVDGCPRCLARLAEMRRQGEAFQQYVYPSTAAAVEAAAQPRRFTLRRWLLAVPALAAVAVAVLLLRPAAPPDDYLGVKGSGLGLTVFVQEGGAGRPLKSGEAVRADAALRFRVRAAAACRLWIFSLDAQGQLSRLYPGEGTGGAAVSGAVEIPGGAVLDGQAGPERIFAVCSPTPAKWKVLAAPIKAATAPGPEGLRAAPITAGLPEGVTVDSVLVEKRS
jgi:hypothetical protein